MLDRLIFMNAETVSIVILLLRDKEAFTFKCPEVVAFTCKLVELGANGISVEGSELVTLEFWLLSTDVNKCVFICVAEMLKIALELDEFVTTLGENETFKLIVGKLLFTSDVVVGEEVILLLTEL